MERCRTKLSSLPPFVTTSRSNRKRTPFPIALSHPLRHIEFPREEGGEGRGSNEANRPQGRQWFSLGSNLTNCRWGRGCAAKGCRLRTGEAAETVAVGLRNEARYSSLTICFHPSAWRVPINVTHRKELDRRRRRAPSIRNSGSSAEGLCALRFLLSTMPPPPPRRSSSPPPSLPPSHLAVHLSLLPSPSSPKVRGGRACTSLPITSPWLENLTGLAATCHFSGYRPSYL